MIDGIINNGPKEKEPEKEKPVKKKESVLAKLQKNKEQIKSKPSKESIVKENDIL